MSNVTITTKKVASIKATMSKKLANVDKLEESDVETLQDMLGELDSMDITLNVLTQTLIGTIVSKFKHHSELGPLAKALVKKWKKVAKDESSTSTNGECDKKKPAAASNSTDAENGSEHRRTSLSCSNSAVEEMQSEWAQLQPYRKNTCHKLHEILKHAKSSLIKDGVNSEAIDHLAVERASEVESAIFQKFPNQQQDYATKARSLCFNIKKNIPLASQILLGQVEAKELVNMTSDQLVSQDKKKEMQEKTKKLMESKQLDWEAQNEEKINQMCGIKGELLQASLFTCGRCKSTKTTSTQKQTRSADEPMTVFVLCLSCGKRWKFS